MAIDPQKMPNGSSSPVTSVRDEKPQSPADVAATLTLDTNSFPSMADRSEYLSEQYRKYGGSQPFTADRAEQYLENEREQSGQTSFARNIVDQIWMDDFRRGPFAYGDAAIAPFGQRIELGDTSGLARGWQRFIGNPVSNVFSGVGRAFENIFNWVNTVEAWGLSRVPGVRGPYVQPLSWADADYLGVGATLSVNPLAVGVITEGGNYQAYQTQREIDAREQYKSAITAQQLEALGYGTFDEWWLANRQSLTPTGGMEPLFVPEGFTLTPESFTQLKAGPQGERVSGVSTAGDFLGELIIPVPALKLPKFLRLGTKGGRFGGLTNRNAGIARVNARMAARTDDSLLFIRSGGSEGKKTAELADAEAVVRADFDDALQLDWIAGKRGQNPNSQALAAIVNQIDNVEDALIFNAAARGSAKHYDMLVESRTLIADALSRQQHYQALGTSSHEMMWLSKPDGMSIKPLLRHNLDGIPDDKLADAAIKAAEDALGLLEDELYLFAELGMQPVTRLGANTILGKRVANAWRAGRSERDYRPSILERVRGKKPSEIATREKTFADREATWTLDDGSTVSRSVSGVEELSFKLSANMRQIGVWKWINGTRGSGYINIYGDADYDSLNELIAAVTDAKVVRKSPELLEDLKRAWAVADTPSKRLRAVTQIEKRVIGEIAKYRGVDAEDALEIYNRVSGRRRQAMDALQQREGRAFAFDPETGKLIIAHPTFVSQLERSLPMLDFRLMDNTLKRYKRFRSWSASPEGLKSKDVGLGPTKSLATTGQFLDELNSVWKAAVLLRLGYTQRNLTEGWLRSLSYLGQVPALEPANVVRGGFRAIANYRNRGRKYGEYLMMKNNEAIVDAQNKLLKSIDDDLAEVNTLLEQGRKADIPYPTLLNHRKLLLKQRDSVTKNLDELSSSALKAQERRDKLRKRRMYDEDGEAFAGRYGDLVRMNASANATVENFLQGRQGRALDMALAQESGNWIRINPDNKNYIPALTRAGEQLVADPVVEIFLKARVAGKSFDDAIVEALEFTGTREGYAWSKKMEISTGQLQYKVERLGRIADAYLPNNNVKKLFLGKTSPSNSEVSVALGSSERSVIHGAEVTEELTFAQDQAKKLNSIRKAIFTWLGSKPETALIRHPFYAEVYAARLSEMHKLAASQGRVLDDALQRSIDKGAHREALKATNDIMFTITRYSNPAALMKFLSPFFAAWENSVRVWGHIVVRDPSIAYRGMFLWDYPNRIGSVYTYDGKKVESDKLGFLLRNPDDGYIMLPKPWTDWLAKRTGGNIPMIPKDAANVITPGDPGWLPGLGEFVIAPVGWYLSSRPETADNFRKMVGDDIYRQFVPFGLAQDPDATDFLGSWMRKGLTLGQAHFFSRYSDDYTKVFLATSKNMIAEHRQNEGTFANAPTAQEVYQATDTWFAFSMLASGVSPVAHTRTSRFHTEITTWRRLQRQYPMDVAQQKMVDQFGEYAIPFMVSSLKKNIPNIRPQLDVWKAVQDNDSVLKRMDAQFEIQGSAASIVAASVAQGEFDPGVYVALRKVPYNKISGQTFAQFMSYEELQNQFILTDKWIKYNSKKAEYGSYVDSGFTSEKSAKDSLRTWAKDTSPGGMADPEDNGEAWLNVFDGFEKKSDLRIIHALINDQEFRSGKVGSSKVWNEIEVYFDRRAEFEGYVNDGYTTKASASDALAEWASSYKNVSIGFSDFYDLFLEDDDFSVSLTGGSK